MKRDEVLKLAKLARIDISNEEADTLSQEFESILSYVGEIKNAKLKESIVEYPVRNVMRVDDNPHESGIHTEKLLAEAPQREGQYIKVKRIL